MICPLCLNDDSHHFDQDKYRSFYKCHHCQLIFVPRDSLISAADEKLRYEAHENSEDDVGYNQYLKNISESIRPHLTSGERGLDFGCGKSKLLAQHLLPHQVDSYDVFFHPDQELLNKKYDFIVMSEVIEHLHHPREEMLRLSEGCSKFFIKTKMYPEQGFAGWFYKRDITHVQFFHQTAFRELAHLCGLNEPLTIGADLFLFKK